MASNLELHVHSATLTLDEGTDMRAPGGEVTRALCGHWEHEPPCRWPHHTAIEVDGGVARLRTVFVAPQAEVDEVRARIEAALRSDVRWRALEVAAGDPDDAARALGERLTSLER